MRTVEVLISEGERGRKHLPKRRWKRSSFAQTTQWMGLSGVLRIVHTGNDLGGGFDRHS